MIEISQQTMTEILQLGSQYMLPIAALLRAIYEGGYKRKLPDGILQILLASAFAGVTSAVNNQTVDWRVIVLEMLGNTVFMAGLLSFIVVYLLRMPNRGLTVDALVGGLLGGVAWFVWTGVLGNDFPTWTLMLGIAAGVAGFIALRFALRQIIRLARIAMYFVGIAIVLILIGGAVLAVQALTTGAIG